HEGATRLSGARILHDAEIERTGKVAGAGRACREWFPGDAEHASQVVAAASGKDPESSAGDLAQGVREHAHHAIAAEREHGFALPRGRQAGLASVLNITRVHAANGQALLAQGALDRRRQPSGLAAGGAWVDDQANGWGHARKRSDRGPRFGR